MGRPLPWTYWRVFLVERGWPMDYVDGLTYREAMALIATINASERGHADNINRARQHARAANRGRR